MLSDKVCIVTGGGHGIGEKTAIELGSLGATVVVNDLGSDVHGKGTSEEPATSTANAIRDNGGEAMAHFGDVTSLEYVQQLLDDTITEYGRVDGVVNFAGVLRDAISYKMTEEQWDTVIHVHLKGHFSLLRTIAAHWREEARGRDLESQRSFVCVSSRSALGNFGQMNYSAAKAGVLGMMRAAARELDRYNIRINALMPIAYTRMIEDIPEDKRSFTEDDYPPEKVAPMVGYLMSDEADDITGCTLRAEGDTIGLMTNPQVHRLGHQPGGWTAADIASQFRSSIAQGIDLDHSDAR